MWHGNFVYYYWGCTVHQFIGHCLIPLYFWLWIIKENILLNKLYDFKLNNSTGPLNTRKPCLFRCKLPLGVKCEWRRIKLGKLLKVDEKAYTFIEPFEAVCCKTGISIKILLLQLPLKIKPQHSAAWNTN